MKNNQLVLLDLVSGCSGTDFLADFFDQNVSCCYSTHEPYVVAGKPIEWNAQ